MAEAASFTPKLAMSATVPILEPNLSGVVMFGLGFGEMLIVGVVAVLLFGKRLPEVAKSLGHSYREFRKGLSDLQTSFDTSTSSYSSPKKSAASRSYDYDDYAEATAPKFEPPPSEPRIEAGQS